MTKKSKSSEIFQFKITLNDSKPRIWRRIQVPSDYTFFELYCAIEDAMGWAGGHLHAFYLRPGNKDLTIIQIPNPEDTEPWFGDVRDERKERIVDYFGPVCKQCVYCYDMGDSWEHTVVFERVIQRKDGVSYPKCVAGQNACPPEDCGGVWGYKDLQKIIHNRNHPEHDEMVEWLCVDDPDDFKPNEFNLSKVEFCDPRKRLKEWKSEFQL